MLYQCIDELKETAHYFCDVSDLLIQEIVCSVIQIIHQCINPSLSIYKYASGDQHLLKLLVWVGFSYEKGLTNL